jgi:hypothetical protein
MRILLRVKPLVILGQAIFVQCIIQCRLEILSVCGQVDGNLFDEAGKETHFEKKVQEFSIVFQTPFLLLPEECALIEQFIDVECKLVGPRTANRLRQPFQQNAKKSEKGHSHFANLMVR